MSYQVAKLIARIAENLPDMSPDVMQRWIDNPKGLQKFLSGLRPPKTEFKVFKTIKLGTGLKTPDDFRKSLEDAGMKVGDWANDILGKPAFTVAIEEVEVDLVVVSVAELGFRKGATREQIYTRAKELGLELCPSEVGPQLRLKYTDQPNGEWLIVAMEPITDSAGSLRLFDVERDDSDLWLCGSYDIPGSIWSADSRFVFVRRK